MDFIKRYKLDSLLLPCIGIAAFLVLWLCIAGHPTVKKSVDDFGDPVVKTTRTGISADLPTPAETWKASRIYITQPFAMGVCVVAALLMMWVLEIHLFRYHR